MDPRPTRHEAFSPDDVRDVLFHTDAEGRWRFLNAAWAEVTGFSVEESLGRVFLEFVHPDDRQRNLEAFRPLIERRKDHCLHEVRYLRRDGGSRWIEVHARLTLGPDGAATGTTGSLRDLSERRLAEADLARAQDQAERADAPPPTRRSGSASPSAPRGSSSGPTTSSPTGWRSAGRRRPSSGIPTRRPRGRRRSGGR